MYVVQLTLLTSSSFSVFVYVHEKITCSGNPRIHPPPPPPNNFLLAPVITWLHFHPIMALSLPPQLYCSLIGWFWHSPPIAEVRWHMPSKFVEIQCLVNFGIKFVLKIFWIKLFSQSCGGICLQRLCQFSVCFILW